MKRAALAIALLATGAASAVQMASQPWVTNRITQATAATLQSAKDYTDAAISGAGGVTPEMVTNIVLDVAPAPGNYAAVSNAAMNAAQNATNLVAAATNGIPDILDRLDAATATNAAQTAALTALPAAVTNIVREASGGIWDAALEVWWTPRMRNGSLTYEATTNVNLNAEN